MEHHLKKIHYKKCFLVKSFIISLVVLILVCVLSTIFYDKMAGMAERLYGITSDDYAEVFTLVFGIWKILVLQFTLIPAIAMCMLEKHIKKQENYDD